MHVRKTIRDRQLSPLTYPFSQAYGTQITEAFKAALDLAERQSTKAVLASIDVLIRLIPSHIWGQTFASTGLMAKLCKEIDNEKSSGAVLAAYLGTLSRMIVADPQAFVALVHHVGSASGRGDHAQLEETLDAMWRAVRFGHACYFAFR